MDLIEQDDRWTVCPRCGAIRASAAMHAAWHQEVADIIAGLTPVPAPETDPTEETP